ncbi:MAG: hypothetical protein Q6L50_10945 [Gloeomargarita sp. GMQP_bins_120]
MVLVPVVMGMVTLGTALEGAAKAWSGWQKLEEAQACREAAEKQYRQKQGELVRCAEDTRALLLDTVERFVALAKRLQQQVAVRDLQTLQGLPITGPSAAPLRRDEMAEAIAQVIQTGSMLGSMVSTAAAAAGGTFTLASLIGTASTGAAISSLSGAAATSATLAWLGGGALAAGGGGMALGSAILGGMTLGPALLVGGRLLAGQGEEALTQARQYAAQVQVAIAQMETYIHLLQTDVQPRIRELMALVQQLDQSSQQALDQPEQAIERGFNPPQDAVVFQQAVLLVKGLVELLQSPLLDAQQLS